MCWCTGVMVSISNNSLILWEDVWRHQPLTVQEPEVYHKSGYHRESPQSKPLLRHCHCPRMSWSCSFTIEVCSMLWIREGSSLSLVTSITEYTAQQDNRSITCTNGVRALFTINAQVIERDHPRVPTPYGTIGTSTYTSNSIIHVAFSKQSCKGLV